MLTMANERLDKLKVKYAKAQLVDADQIRVIYLVIDDPRKYWKNAIASLNHGIVHQLAARFLRKPAHEQALPAAVG